MMQDKHDSKIPQLGYVFISGFSYKNIYKPEIFYCCLIFYSSSISLNIFYKMLMVNLEIAFTNYIYRVYKGLLIV